MSDAAKIADRYIARDGKAPTPESEKMRPCLASTTDIITVATFLGWHDRDFFGGVNNDEAWLAFCRIVGFPAGEFKEVIRG